MTSFGMESENDADYFDRLLFEVEDAPLLSYFNQQEPEPACLDSGNRESAVLPTKKAKNAYLQKISKLDTDQVIRREQLNYSKCKGDSGQEKDDKKKRNRESARKSRKRKNIYMEVLENKVKQLTEEIEQLKGTIEAKNELISRLTLASQHDHRGDAFFMMRRKILDNLGKALQNDSGEHEVRLLLNAVRDKLGINSPDRSACIDYYFNQILDVIVPDFQKFVLFSCFKRLDLFSDKFLLQGVADPTWAGLILSDVELTLEQRKSLSLVRNELDSVWEQVQLSVLGLSEAKERLVAASRTLGEKVILLQNTLGGHQLGKLILGVDRNKYRRELLNENLWDFLHSLVKKQNN